VLALADLQLPTADAEIWRYSRIAELDVSAFSIQRGSLDVSGDSAVLSIDADADSTIESPDVFAEYNASHQQTVCVDVPADTTVEEPIVIEFQAEDGSATFPRTVIRLGAHATCTVIERFRSAGEAPSLTSPLLSIEAGPGAKVTYLAVNDLNEVSWQIGHQLISAGRDSSVRLSTITLGGYYTRVRTEATSKETGSEIEQVALYFAGGDQMHDFRVIQNHVAEHTSSDLLFKGAVQDHARSVYTGMISIDEGAKGTSANQTNRNLTLSEGAWAESVPNLDIRNNDVRCSHASTVGPINEEQRYYLESRGVPPEVAERLVVLGFFDEVLSRLPDGTIVDEVRDRVARKLSIGVAS
jgi:Fe-S cluster assembly protein SufD